MPTQSITEPGIITGGIADTAGKGGLWFWGQACLKPGQIIGDRPPVGFRPHEGVAGERQRHLAVQRAGPDTDNVLIVTVAEDG